MMNGIKVTCGKIIYMGDVQWPEKVNGAFMKTITLRERWIEFSLS
jgi:hypothetical protein